MEENDNWIGCPLINGHILTLIGEEITSLERILDKLENDESTENFKTVKYMRYWTNLSKVYWDIKERLSKHYKEEHG